MGYRSDVMYVAEFEDEQSRDAAWAAAKLKYELIEGSPFIEATGFDKFEEDCIVFEADSIKWYDSYPEVKMLEEMFRRFFNEGFNANVKFICVGEELNDLTDEILESPDDRDVPDWFYDQLYVERTIVAPWSV